MKKFTQNSRMVFVFTILAAALWMSSPVLTYIAAQTENTSDSTQTKLQASLSGTAINNLTPSGYAEYKLESDGTRKFELEISSVNLPNGTNLNVYVNNTLIGQITVNSSQNGKLELKTDDNQNVPLINSADVITIRQQNSNTVLTGTFGMSSPTPTVSPSPTNCTDGPLFATLNGAIINGEIPRGFAQYKENGNNQLKVFVRFLNLPEDTQLTVSVDNINVGQFDLRKNGNGNLFIDDPSVNVSVSSTITIRNGNTVVLQGTFNCLNPTPSPTVSPSPTAFPSPTVSPSPTLSPTPNQARFFSAKLSGNQVVPTVNTNARGIAAVLLNESGNQIQVFVGFFGLSSSQTTASINCPALPGQNAPATFNLGTIGGTSAFLPVQTFSVTQQQVAQLRTGLCYVTISSQNFPNGEIRGQIRIAGASGDFGGDGKSELAIFRPSNGVWYFLNSSNNLVRAEQFGMNGDTVVTGDYDGDGFFDKGVFRVINNLGYWFIQRSSDNTVISQQWGAAGDRPIVGDFDGDSRTDLAIFRPSNGTWYIRRSSDNFVYASQFGSSSDIPLAGDFDSDGRTDIAVYRPSNGVWYILQSSSGTLRSLQFGTSGDIPLTGDFDGDGATDIAVFRPSNGTWYFVSSSNGAVRATQFGTNGDIPTIGDFDADGKTDVAVFRPSNGYWYILRSSNSSFAAYQFGQNGDRPVVAAQ